jgi:predicted RNase H-like HicB family nuclease
LAIGPVVYHFGSVVDLRGCIRNGRGGDEAITRATFYLTLCHNGVVQAPILLHVLQFGHELFSRLFPTSLLIFVHDNHLHLIPITIEWLEHNSVIANTSGMPVELLALKIVSGFSVEPKLALTIKDKVLIVLNLLS